MSEILLSKDLRAARVELTSARRAFWTAVIFPCFTGSAVTLTAGLIVSILSWTRLVATSRFFLAYSTIGLLFSSFILMFLGGGRHGQKGRGRESRTNRTEQARRT